MANTYFSFKEFTIHQSQCAMKVSTDACLFGAVVADFFYSHSHAPSKVLDIGTGTGLLALMLAQKNPKANFLAIELDEDAATQASRNVQESPWSNRVEVIQQDVLSWSESSLEKFDLIICNPPFFSQHLLSENKNRAMARHDESLSLPQLVAIATRCMSEQAYFAILLPHIRMESCIELFQKPFHLVYCLESSDKIGKAPNRFIGIFSNAKAKSPTKYLQMALHELNGQRTAVWNDLISAYYLH